LRVVRDRSGRINRQFPEPLPESEVTSTAKSVGTWTWRNITPAGLQTLIERTHTPERQAERGRKSGEARRLSREQERATARLLRAKGYTQQAIAEELGVSQPTVTRWLS
jgi:DNA-binding NarL/FixJ family response regulator